MSGKGKKVQISFTHTQQQQLHTQPKHTQDYCEQLQERQGLIPCWSFFLVRAKNPTNNSYLIQPFGGAGHAAL